MTNTFSDREFPLLIAEIGGNHQGSLSKAYELTNLAIESGVDCVKFQVYYGDDLVNKSQSPERHSHFRSFELSIQDHKDLALYCRSKGVEYMASIWDLSSWDELKKYINIVKIGSGDLTAYPIIQEFCKHEKPIILSTGLASLGEVSDTVQFLRKQSSIYSGPSNLCILQCTSMYPIDNSEAHLSVMDLFKEQFNVTTGYSDHTIGIHALSIAPLLGADVLEFHFTDDPQNTSFRDHQVSLTLTDVIELKRRIQTFKSLFGTPLKQPQASEVSNGHLKSFRRAAYLSKDYAAGTIIDINDIVYLRPCEGLPAEHFSMLEGAITLTNVQALEPLIIGENIQVSPKSINK